MSSRSFTLRLLPERLAVCRLASGRVPRPPAGPSFWATVLAAGEASLVCQQEDAPPGAEIAAGWRALRVQETFAFDAVGVLAELSSVLAAAGVPLLALSTFETDLLLVREPRLEHACRALEAAGHRVEREAGSGR
jgi:hypothetical protein